MMFALWAVGLAILAAVGMLLRWWLSGGGADTSGYDPASDAAVIAEGFPEQKYRALCRLLDPIELRSLDREHSMPADLIHRLAIGRREAVDLYLAELQEEFRRAQWLYAYAQATGFKASPFAVRELVAGWWHFGNLCRKARHSAKTGDLTCKDVAPLVKEAQVWVEKLTGAIHT